MLTAPGLNERMDYLPLASLALRFWNLFWRRRRAPNTIKQSTRTRRGSADSTRLERTHGQPWWWRWFPDSRAAGVATENSAKTALVNHLSLKSSRARGAGRVVSSVSRAPIFLFSEIGGGGDRSVAGAAELGGRC